MAKPKYKLMGEIDLINERLDSEIQEYITIIQVNQNIGNYGDVHLTFTPKQEQDYLGLVTIGYVKIIHNERVSFSGQYGIEMWLYDEVFTGLEEQGLVYSEGIGVYLV